MPKQKLNGYWTNKANPDMYIFVEKVFKKGYVTGFKYSKNAEGKEVIHLDGLKITHEELERDYERNNR